MAVYAKKLSKEWRKAFEEYEKVCGYEPMYQEEIDSGEMTPYKAWSLNVKFLEDVLATVTNLSTPEDPELEL